MHNGSIPGIDLVVHVYLTEVFLLVREPLHLKDAHLEAVLHPPPVLGGWAECPPQADNDKVMMM